MNKKVFAINGMKCEHCEANVENTVKALAGVENVKANRMDCTLTIEYDEDKISPSQLKEAVDGIGKFELTI